MLHTFKDDADGYYQVEVAPGEPMPEWTAALTPCDSQPPAFEGIPAPLASISPRQIRMALTRAGLRTQVEAAVAAGDQDLKDWWEFSTAFERLNPEVEAMGAALGQTPEQLDNLWKLGATL
jgi:hypothetical protein